MLLVWKIRVLQLLYYYIHQLDPQQTSHTFLLPYHLTLWKLMPTLYFLRKFCIGLAYKGIHSRGLSHSRRWHPKLATLLPGTHAVSVPSHPTLHSHALTNLPVLDHSRWAFLHNWNQNIYIMNRHKSQSKTKSVEEGVETEAVITTTATIPLTPAHPSKTSHTKPNPKHDQCSLITWTHQIQLC